MSELQTEAPTGRLRAGEASVSPLPPAEQTGFPGAWVRIPTPSGTGRIRPSLSSVRPEEMTREKAPKRPKCSVWHGRGDMNGGVALTARPNAGYAGTSSCHRCAGGQLRAAPPSRRASGFIKRVQVRGLMSWIPVAAPRGHGGGICPGEARVEGHSVRNPRECFSGPRPHKVRWVP